MTKGQRELIAAGFTNIKPLGTRERIGSKWTTDGNGNVVPGLLGPAVYGKWFECDTPRHALQLAGPEHVLILRQASGIWHTFYHYEATASGSNPNGALFMGLGDAIETDGELATYSRLVSRAPEAWANRFAGLSAAKSQVYHDRTAA